MATQVYVPPQGNYQTAQRPRIIPVYTDAAYATIVAAGWFNSVSNQPVLAGDVLNVFYNGDSNGWFKVSIASDGVVTLSPMSTPGEMTFSGAAVVGNVPMATDTDGNMEDSGIAAADIARWAGATVIDNLASFNSVDGEIEDSGIAKGAVATYAGATVIDNLASFNSVSGEVEDSGIVKTDVLQASTLVTDYQQFISLNDILLASVGTWTMTRIAQGNYGLRHTVADDTSVIGWDITPMLRAAANLGFRLASFDLIYSIAALALDAHSVVLDRIVYANNVAVSVTSVPLTGALATATQANPYVSNVAVTTPAFNNTADSKYVLELTVNAGATSEYDLLGLNLRFTKSVA